MNNFNDNQSSDGSIIRSIMIEQEEKERVSYDPLMVIIASVNTLKDREREVVIERYGLENGEKATLDAIGKKFNVTRERVRQIESAAIAKLSQKKSRDLHNLIRAINSHIVASGGAVSVEEVAEYFKMDRDGREGLEISALRLIMAVNAEVEELENSEIVKHGWKLKEIPSKMIIDTLKVAEKLMLGFGEPVKLSAIWEKFQESNEYKEYSETLTPSVFAGLLKVGEKMAATEDSKWGLTSWPTVVPKRIRDKVFVVLEKAGKPLHFREISEKINKMFEGKPVLSRTVHNELIGDKRFVLVGRGIYGLKEMGFSAGVVADVIADVLKESAEPLSTDQIVEEVMKSRQVKRNTVIANLQNKSKFKKVGKGLYTVA